MSGIRCVIERNQSVLSQEITVKKKYEKKKRKRNTNQKEVHKGIYLLVVIIQ